MVGRRNLGSVIGQSAIIAMASDKTRECRRRHALEAGLDFLSACQAASGAVLEPVADPWAAVIRPRSLSKRGLFHALAGADVWNTVNALAVFKHNGRDARPMERFLLRLLERMGGLCYWSARAGLCCETTAAMAGLAGPSVRRKLVGILRRAAYPDGRWPSYIVDGVGGYAQYLTAPSVTAWILPLLDRADPLHRAGQRYLDEALAGRPIWREHPAFYQTPFYPAHLAARIIPRPSVVGYTLDSQDGCGGWGFGDPPTSLCAPLPTALAILTLRCFPSSPSVDRAIERGVDWLLGAQANNGSFRRGKAPRSVYYLGDVYSTCVSLFALGAH